MKIIRITTDLEMTVHDFPEGTHEEQNHELRELIGNDCRIYEHVMPEHQEVQMWTREVMNASRLRKYIWKAKEALNLLKLLKS